MTKHPCSSPARSRTALSLGVCAVLAFSHAAALEKSKGVYRIPYADGTEVRISRDHIQHGKGRIDMVGKGGGLHKIAAAADGTVKFIEDGFDKKLDCSGPDDEDPADDLPISEQKNNFVWIEHANGEWTKYSHMAKGSTTGKAKLKVGESVKAGAYLGDESDVGCAGGDHLHFEVGVPHATKPLTSTGGFLADNDNAKRNRIPRICGISGGVFQDEQSYTARKVPGAIKPGAREVARHGVPARDYQCLFDQAVAAGYALDWIDGFDVGGKVHYNAIFRPAGAPTAGFHGLTGAQYQQRFDEYTGKGYRLHQVDVFNSDGGLRYAAIFRKQGGPAFQAYHGLSAAAHQQRLDALVKDGYRPRNIAVASSGGDRRYAALYEKSDIGSWQAKSQLGAAEYQQAFDDNAKAGRGLVYVNAYVHGGKPQFSAIWSAKGAGPLKARHGLSGAQYQDEWNSATGAGYFTRDVTGYSAGGAARYAAIWRK